MGDDALFNLRWDAQRTALLGSVAALYRDESFVDVTVVTNGEMFKAHKLLLSASSPYLKTILESVPSQHAVLFMPHVTGSDLSNVLKFIYEGEIKINRRALKSFLETAKLLKIKGMDFDFEEELTDLDTSINQSGQSNGNATSSSAISNSTRTASPAAITKASTTTTNQNDEEPPEKLKILSALLLNKKDPQGSLSDSSYSTAPSSNISQAILPHANSGSNRSHISNMPDLHDLKNGSHMSHGGEELEESEDDAHNDLDMVIEDENSRSHQRMISMDGDGELIDIDEEEIQEYEEEEDDISILPEVSLQESEESYTISNHHLQQALKMRSGQSVSPGQVYGSQKGSAATGSGSNYYEMGHSEGVGGLRKTKRYVQCGSCSKVLSSLSALKRHMEDVHCARIQGKCIICGRVYSSRNSLLTHVYSAHKKHHDYKAVARIIRESDFEKFATA
ncbi:unnamed protein product [Allacma fusca]|uniref:Broad-complex n=1 Tax=Allacma fusca TaxID=39272 RepID=A0A8J2NQE2_9HEXA|nr:unnamed protein product [Allacma fusca]